ncbi:MAG: hypothetical protein FWG87_08990 [Defluviitaleaceae bacterium]|nr:hypothetical protein [Defluviitaleaceae bacterium]
MPYINQGQGRAWDTNACGAYAIGYYRWRTNNIPAGVGDGLTGQAEAMVTASADFVQGIYEAIKFGEAAEELELNPDYSNPVDMLTHLNALNGVNASPYYNSDTNFNDAFDELFNALADGLPNLITEIPNGQGFFIAIGGVVPNLHYVLAHKAANGNWDYIINPSDGVINYNGGDGFGNIPIAAVPLGMPFLNAGIWIPVV